MIVSFGELLVDMIREGGCYIPCPGGAPSNFAVGVSRLGQESRLVSCVGKEPFGDFLIRHVESEGVDVSFVKRSEKRTTLAFVELNEGIPDFFFYRGADTDISPNNICPQMLEDASHLHCGGFSLSSLPVRDALFRLLGLARKAGLNVSFSPNTRPDIWDRSLDRHLRKALGHVDVLIASESEFGMLSGGSAPSDVMGEHGISRLVITRGIKGSVMHTDSGLTEFPAFRVDAADATGSGDAYAAGLVCGLLQGKESRELMAFASGAAAISVTKRGAMSALPRLREVTAFLEKNPST